MPLAATNCFGVKPCMHSTATERINAGCLDAVWEGTYGDKPTRYKLETIGPPHNLSYYKPIAPSYTEKFHPAIGEQCDLTDFWAPNRGGHVTDATEAHWHQRLRGVKNSLLLSIGSSIDHGAMKEVRAAVARNGLTALGPELTNWPVSLSLSRRVCARRAGGSSRPA